MNTEVKTAEVTPITAALARKEAPGVVKRTSAYNIDPKHVDRREGWNPRFDFGEITELAASIKAQGLLVPLRVKRKPDGRLELIDGDRRLTAIELLLKEGTVFPEGVPSIIVDKAQDDLTSLYQMFVTNSGKPFLPLEEAAAYKRLRDQGQSINQIHKATGRAARHITEILALLDADDSVKEALKDGSIGKTLARDIATQAKGDKAKQREIVEAAKASGKKGKALRGAKAKVQEARVAKAKAAGRKVKATTLGLEALTAIGLEVQALLDVARQAASLPGDANVMDWVGKDAELRAAFLFGALAGLQRAAGVEVNLDPGVGA